MALQPFSDRSSMALIISVRNDGSVAQMSKDLDDALTLIKASFDDRDCYFQTIDITGTWKPGDGELVPWEEPYRSGWEALVHNPDMREPLAAWLGRVTNLVMVGNDTQISCLSEHDETQFGEVPAFLLAFADQRYLPIFIGLMKVWDLDHGVMLVEMAEQLVERHGRSAATAELVEFIKAWA